MQACVSDQARFEIFVQTRVGRASAAGSRYMSRHFVVHLNALSCRVDTFTKIEIEHNLEKKKLLGKYKFLLIFPIIIILYHVVLPMKFSLIYKIIGEFLSCSSGTQAASWYIF